MPQNERDYDARFRCRYCGAPCREGGVCHAHSDLADIDQLTLEEILALEAAENGEDVEALKGKGSR